MSSLAARLAALPPEKRALLARQAAAAPPRETRPEIPRLPRDGRSFAPSFAQERLWFIEQWEQAPVYTERLALALDGPLSPARLAATLAHLVARHESLRTRFVVEATGLRQQVEAPFSPALPVLELSGLAEPARERELDRLLAREDQLRFVPAALPLLRLVLYRLGPRRHVVSFAVHHLVFDAWSVAVFFGELFAPPPGAGRESEPALQYADFAAWQRDRFAAGGADGELAYWRQTLLPLPPPLELPTDRPRPKVRSGHGSRCHFRLDPTTTGRLSALAQRHDATLFMALLAAFGLLLASLSAARRLAVGVPITNRSRPELESLIGLFVNTVVIPFELSPETRFSSLLAAVRGRVLGAQTHKELPFERLVEDLQPERDFSRTPLFQALFDVQTLPDPSFPPGLTGKLLPLDRDAAKTDLYLNLQRSGGGLDGELEYASDLFDHTTMLRCLGAFETLLAALLGRFEAGGEETAAFALPLLARASRHQLLAEHNDTAPWPVPAQSFLTTFAAVAARQPEAVAARSADRAMGYGEILARAAALAAELEGQRIGAEQRVAVALPRGFESLIALLGVLQAGAVYLPLDPEHPVERQAMQLADGGAVLVLTRPELLAKLPQPLPRVVFVDATSPLAAMPAKAPPPPPGDSLAYVLSTSGSTGRPKPVGVRHAGLAAFLAAMAEAPGLGPGDVLLAVTTLGFDIAALELFLPLVVGGSVAFASAEETRDGRLLARRLESSGATAIQATPATWRLLLDAGWRPPAAGLKLLSGGQALPPALVHELAPGHTEIWNLYGPTETTIWSAATRVRAADAAGARVAIGRPIPGTTIHVVDRGFELVPLGATGEIVIGGAGLARGYLGRPGATAAAFVPDAWGPAGSRVYKTGDLGRRRPDGRLDFLGRRDHQVKIRGHRIEPAEIEAVLVADAAVTAAAVLAVPEAGGDARLVAFVASAEPAESLCPRLRESLRKQLPAAFVPGTLLVLEALPADGNGKLDRKTLLARAATAGPGSREAAGRPPTAAEARLLPLWAEVLKLPPETLDATTSFFDLGGHSLATTRLLAGVRRQTGVEVSLLGFFEHPTLAGLAAAVAVATPPAQGLSPRSLPSCLVPIRLGGGERPIFWVPPAAGSPLPYLELARRLPPELPSWGLQAPGLADDEPPLTHTPALAARFVAAIKELEPRGPYRLAGWSFGAVLTWQMARELAAQGDEVELLALLDGGMDREQVRRWARPRAALQALVELGRIFLETSLPRSWDEARVLASWVGLSLPSGTLLAATRGLAARRRLFAGTGAQVLRSLRVLKGTFLAAVRHQPGPYRGSVDLFRTRRRGGRDPLQETLERLVEGPIAVHPIPGNHMSLIMDQNHVEILAASLARALAGRSPSGASAPGPIREEDQNPWTN